MGVKARVPRGLVRAGRGVLRTRLNVVWAKAEGLDWACPERDFFRLLVEAMRSGKNVLIAAGEQAELWRQLVSTTWPRHKIVVTSVGADESAEHVRLGLLAPFDVVLQAADVDASTQARVFRRILFHLRADGVYLTPNPRPFGPELIEGPTPFEAPLPNEDGLPEQPYRGSVWQLVADAEAARFEDYPHNGTDIVLFRDRRGLGRQLREVRVVNKALWIRNQRRVQVKLTENEADAVLIARPQLGREIGEVPAATLRSSAGYVHNGPADLYFTPTMPSPRLRLRRYDKSTCSRGQIVATGDLIWPDTFRHHLYPRLRNVYVEESAPRFGYVRRSIANPDELPGAWYHLDSEWPGHFGHMLTDQLGRMWGWDAVKGLEPDVKLLLTLQHDREPAVLHDWEIALFETFGISAEDVHVFSRPCRPERLYSATSMFSLANYVHPDLVAIWDSTGDALAAQAQPGPRPKRLFCTRPTSLKRPCHNTGEVEDLFRRHGFEVIDPADYSLPEQITMFRAAEAVGGFVGSALFTLAFCPVPKPVFAVGPITYTARNENLICAARGHSLTTAWTESDLAHPEGGWTQEAFAAGFTMGAAEAAFLDKELSRLDPS